MAINKRLLAKKDMNFFAEFTANAAKMRRMFGYESLNASDLSGRHYGLSVRLVFPAEH